MGKPRLPLDVRVKAHLQTYRMNPPALLTAITALLNEEIEQRIHDVEKVLARQKCLGKHPVGCDRVVCAECAKQGAFVEQEAPDAE